MEMVGLIYGADVKDQDLGAAREVEGKDCHTHVSWLLLHTAQACSRPHACGCGSFLYQASGYADKCFREDMSHIGCMQMPWNDNIKMLK